MHAISQSISRSHSESRVQPVKAKVKSACYAANWIAILRVKTYLHRLASLFSFLMLRIQLLCKYHPIKFQKRIYDLTSKCIFTSASVSCRWQ